MVSDFYLCCSRTIKFKLGGVDECYFYAHLQPEFKPIYFIKTEIFAPILPLMTNECKGFQISDLYFVSTGNGLYMDEIKSIPGKE